MTPTRGQKARGQITRTMVRHARKFATHARYDRVLEPIRVLVTDARGPPGWLWVTYAFSGVYLMLSCHVMTESWWGSLKWVLSTVQLKIRTTVSDQTAWIFRSFLWLWNMIMAMFSPFHGCNFPRTISCLITRNSSVLFYSEMNKVLYPLI